MINYINQLTQTTRNYWNDKALCDWHGEEFTFGEVAANIARLHLLLEKTGIGKGEKITIYAPNSARWATTFLAINTSGAVVVPLLADFTAEAVCNLVDHSGSVVIFTDKDSWKRLNIEKMPKLRYVINITDWTLLWSADGEKVAGIIDNLEADFAARYPDGFTKEDVIYKIEDMKELAVINYTSGTTSAPKGVMLRYECFSASIDFAIRHIYACNKDSIVSMLPMGHIYGMVFEFLYPLCFGVTVYYLGKTPAASTLLKAVAEVKPYLIITVPLVMEKVYKSSIQPVLGKWYMKILTAIPGINKVIYKTITKKLIAAFGGKVQQFIMGGAALNPDVERAFRKMGLPYTVGYGMTEAAPLLAYAQPQEFVPGSCGMKVDSAQVRIDSEDPEHIPGEIQAKGTNICSGYFNNPEASENAFTEDGFLRTGDLGVMDAKGNIFIKGRSKTMILSANGQNIYPEEIEASINSMEFVSESLVVDRASKLTAIVRFDQEQIKAKGLSALDVHDLPEKIRVMINRIMPSYSQISKVEEKRDTFDKTPKGSIKRFLYC
ncbi:MAG: AMP-binding protein [Bacteroidales bacterium]|nr:AMP-binding protein [Bacteroidales bacterium]